MPASSGTPWICPELGWISSPGGSPVALHWYGELPPEASGTWL
ncbi:MAG: hypothetical protein R3A51_20480 [Nannocystaceae bacterium]